MTAKQNEQNHEKPLNKILGTRSNSHTSSSTLQLWGQETIFYCSFLIREIEADNSNTAWAQILLGEVQFLCYAVLVNTRL